MFERGAPKSSRYPVHTLCAGARHCMPSTTFRSPLNLPLLPRPPPSPPPPFPQPHFFTTSQSYTLIKRPAARTQEYTALIREGGEVESYHVIRLQGSEIGRWGWWHMRLKPERTAYIPQQFKTKPRPQTAPKESGVLDDSIRLPAHFSIKFHLHTKHRLRCNRHCRPFGWWD